MCFHLISLAVVPPPVLPYCLLSAWFPVNLQSALLSLYCLTRLVLPITWPPLPLSPLTSDTDLLEYLVFAAWHDLAEHARGRALCTTELPCLHLDSVFPIAAGSMPWAKGQTAHTIFLLVQSPSCFFEGSLIDVWRLIIPKSLG